MFAAVDEDMVSLAIMNWIGEICNTRGIHIAIDGKGLRAAAHKVRDERTPYILNAICNNGGEFVLQVKRNCPALYAELMDFKRQHWAVENSLHYVLDETFGEDKSTIRLGKNTMSVLRKCAYNIARLLQMEDWTKE